VLPADGSKRLDDRGIGNVHANAGYQEVHAVNSRNRDMRSVSGSPVWDFAGGQNAGRQLRNLGRDVQQREGLQDFQPLARRYKVSRASFIEDKRS
jgi:hypothetical protein